MSKINLMLSDSPATGKQISFVAPCGSDTVTCLTINDIDYTICDAAGNNLAGIAGIWASGAFVSVIIDVDSAKAYIQNANTNKYIEEKFSTMPDEVLASIPSITNIDLSNFRNGTWTETIDGEIINHTATFDTSGRPITIDNITIKWEA